MNKITENNINYKVKNPTSYDPTTIVSRYVSSIETTVAQEIQQSIQSGITAQDAAQNLFVRAVRTEEYEKNRALIAKIIIVYNLLQAIQGNTNTNIPAIIISSFFIYFMATPLCFGLFTGITDALGINIQYSI